MRGMAKGAWKETGRIIVVSRAQWGLTVYWRTCHFDMEMKGIPDERWD